MKDPALERTYTKLVFGRLQQKTLENMLKQELIMNFGYDHKLAIADALIERFMKIIREYAPEQQRVEAYQIRWLGIDKDDYPGMGKTIAQTKLKPVTLTFITHEEIEKLANGIKPRELLPERIAQVYQEAYQQGALLSNTDVAVLFNISLTTAHKMKRQWEIQNQKVLPNRGSIHDLGLTYTHKKQVIQLYLQGHFTQEIARKLDHDPKCVDTYIRDFERIKPLLEKNMPTEKIAFFTGMGVRLVKEYKKLWKDLSKNNNNNS
ncbi:DUF1670 domain-containing protein [bacterium]|nr:DUF1670 domain-containing protein [bacterium]